MVNYMYNETWIYIVMDGKRSEGFSTSSDKDTK